MFEIGTSLREARLRQRLDFPAVEQLTKIRGKYLRALEDEQFDILPSQTYVKGFLRNYAEVLGLDGQLYVDEYNTRFVSGDEDTPLRPRRSTVRPQRKGRLESNVVLIVLAAIALVAALTIAAWNSGKSREVVPQAQHGVMTAGQGTIRRRYHKPTARLVIVATRGSSHVTVHAGSVAGRQLWDGTLERGKRLSFVRPQMWLQISTPENLTVRLNGRVAQIGSGSPRTFTVTPRHVRAISAA
jgi:hypothetical protein